MGIRFLEGKDKDGYGVAIAYDRIIMVENAGDGMIRVYVETGGYMKVILLKEKFSDFIKITEYMK